MNEEDKLEQKDYEELVASMIKGQIAFGGGFNSENDVNKTAVQIVNVLKGFNFNEDLS